MLPLADTEKLIREKDEEVSKDLSSPLPPRPQVLFEVPLWPPRPHAHHLAPVQLRRMQEMLEKMQAQMQQSQTPGEQSDAL